MAVRGCADGGVRVAKLPRSTNAELEPAVAVRRSTALHSPTAADGRPVGVGAEPGANQRQDAAVSEPIQATAAAKRADAAVKAEVGRLAAAAKKEARSEAACGKAAKSLQRWAGEGLLRTVCFPLVELCVRQREGIAVDSVIAQIRLNLAAIRAKDAKLHKRLTTACFGVADALSTNWAGDALWPTAFPRIEAIMVGRVAKQGGGDCGTPTAAHSSAPSGSAPPGPPPPASAPSTRAAPPPAFVPPAPAPLDSAPPPPATARRAYVGAKSRKRPKPRAAVHDPDDEDPSTGPIYTCEGHASLTHAQLLTEFNDLPKSTQDAILICPGRFPHMTAALQVDRTRAWDASRAQKQKDDALARAHEEADRKRGPDRTQLDALYL